MKGEYLIKFWTTRSDRNQNITVRAKDADDAARKFEREMMGKETTYFTVYQAMASYNVDRVVRQA